MANLERIREVVALIEEDERGHGGKHFDMHSFIIPPVDPKAPAFCNTKMCFAGWALVHRDGMEQFLNNALSHHAWEGWEASEEIDIEAEARSYMELTKVQSDSIFYRTGISTVAQLKQEITWDLGEQIWPEYSPESPKPSWRRP